MPAIGWLIGGNDQHGADFTVDASVEKFTGASIQAVVTTAQIYDLGPLTDGTYNFNFKTSGTLAKTLQFTVSSAVPPPNPIDDARAVCEAAVSRFSESRSRSGRRRLLDGQHHEV